MTLNEYIQKSGYGATGQLAKLLQVSGVLVHLWAKGKRPIPVARAAAIEKATGGAVTRRDLRPDDWQDHWPELATQAQAVAA